MTGSHACDEFTRVVDVSDLGDDERRLDVVADEDERRALAADLDLLALEALEATAWLAPAGSDREVRLRASFRARVVQACVVTLEPVESVIEESFGLTYRPVDEADAAAREVEVVLDEEDPPEPLVGGRVDVGAAIAEHLALALDPYPRRPGAHLDASAAETRAAAGEGEGPFAVLGRLTETVRGNT